MVKSAEINKSESESEKGSISGVKVRPQWKLNLFAKIIVFVQLQKMTRGESNQMYFLDHKGFLIDLESYALI